MVYNGMYEHVGFYDVLGAICIAAGYYIIGDKHKNRKIA